MNGDELKNQQQQSPTVRKNITTIWSSRLRCAIGQQQTNQNWEKYLQNYKLAHTVIRVFSVRRKCTWLSSVLRHYLTSKRAYLLLTVTTLVYSYFDVGYWSHTPTKMFINSLFPEHHRHHHQKVDRDCNPDITYIKNSNVKKVLSMKKMLPWSTVVFFHHLSCFQLVYFCSFC